MISSPVERKLTRGRLETLAAETACLRLSAEELDRLAAINDRHAAAHAAGDVKAVLRCNEDFHFALYRAAGMPMLMQIIESLWLQVGPVLNLLYAAYARDWPGGRHHRAMLDAAARRDPPALLAALAADLADGRRQLEPILPEG